MKADKGRWHDFARTEIQYEFLENVRKQTNCLKTNNSAGRLQIEKGVTL